MSRHQVVRVAWCGMQHMGHPLAGANNSWCPELESRTTQRRQRQAVGQRKERPRISSGGQRRRGSRRGGGAGGAAENRGREDGQMWCREGWMRAAGLASSTTRDVTWCTRARAGAGGRQVEAEEAGSKEESRGLELTVRPRRPSRRGRGSHPSSACGSSRPATGSTRAFIFSLEDAVCKNPYRCEYGDCRH